jgi:general secretion pathway protein D
LPVDTGSVVTINAMQHVNLKPDKMTRISFSSTVFAFALSASLAQAQTPVPQAAPPPAAQTQPAAPAPAVPGGLNLNNASLLEVINLLAQDLHINYILDSSVKGGTVTINTFGAVRDVDLRPLLETILRMNNLAMVQVGNIYRIIPIANIAKQPVSPISEPDPSKISDDERLVLNLVFLRYVSSSEMTRILQPFMGDGAQLTDYDPANLLIILDNSRNMRRTLELINMFDSDTFAGQRVRSFDVKFGRPTDLTKELDEIFKAISLSDKTSNAVRFLPVDRINTILAVSPNPNTFTEVEKWLAKLDIPAKVTAGSIDNYVYKLKYARAEIVGTVVMQLYGAPGSGYGNGGGIYGGVPGNSSYPASGYAASGFGGAGTGQYANQYGGAGNFNGTSGGAYPQGAFPQGNGTQGSAIASPQMQNGATNAIQGASVNSPLTSGVTGGGTGFADRTGSYLGAFQGNGFQNNYSGPRIIPNPFDNTLLVQGTPQQWEQIKHLLEQMDVPPRQVLIDAKIYEVDLVGDFQFGVESFLQKANTANSTVPAHQLLGNATSTGLNLTAGMLVGQSRQLLAMLQANESTSKTKVLSAPSVIATDSIPASITVGSSVPTLTSESVNGITQGGTSQFTNSISNTSTGIGLNILARVNASGVVTMVINQNVTAPIPNPLQGAAGGNINSPSFSQRNVSTQVTVEDGDTIAIGGIITENHTVTSAGIPLLDRIPYIGGAFGLKTTHNDRTELIIFLTPRVIYDTTQVADATEELKQKVKGLRKAMNKE